MSTTEKTRPQTEVTPQAEAGPAPRRPRFTVTLGPFGVTLNDRDGELQRPTVVVAFAYVVPDDQGTAAAALLAVQARFWGLVGAGLPLTTLEEMAGALYNGLVEPRWPVEGGEPFEHGVQIAQVAVSLVPEDVTPDRLQPVAAVTVSNPDLVP